MKKFFSLSEHAQRYALLILLVFGFAAVVRFALLHFFSLTDPTIFFDGDSWGFLQPALNLLSGNGFSNGTEAPYQPAAFRTPGYPVFLALHYWLFSSFFPALLTQIAFSLGIGFLIVKIADDFLSPRMGIVAAAMFFFLPFSLLIPLQYTTLVVFTFVLTLATYVWLHFLKTGSTGALSVVAVLLPLLVYIRPIALFIVGAFVAVLVLQVIWKQISIKKTIRTSVLLIVVFVLGLTPWMMRNYQLFDEFSFSSLPPYQLYFFESVAVHAHIYNNSFVDSRKGFEERISDKTGKGFQQHKNEYIEFSELSPVVLEEGLRFVAEHPFAFWETRLGQVHNFFVRDGIRYWLERFRPELESKKGFAIELYEVHGVTEGQTGLVVTERLFWYFILLGFFVGTVIGFRRKNPYIASLSIIVLYFALLSGVMSSAPFRFPVEALLLIVSVYGLKKIIASRTTTLLIKKRVVLIPVVLIGVVAAALLVSELLLRFTQYRVFIPNYRYPVDYERLDKELIYDITPNFQGGTHFFYEHPYKIWSNNIGCFDTLFSKKDAEHYIYLAGDSFTWGWAPFEEKWGTRLQDMLGVRTAKCGVSGFGTARALKKAERIIEGVGAPELIVVGYFSENDPVDDVLYEQLIREDYELYNSQRCEVHNVENVFKKTEAYLYNNSVVYNVFRVLLIEDTHEALHGLTLGCRNGIAYEHPAIDDEAAYTVNQKYITGFKELADRVDAKLLFILIPTNREVEMGDGTPSVHTATIGRFLEEEGIEYFDPLPFLREAHISTGEPLYWKYDYVKHLNIKGNHILADIVGEYILEQRLIEKQP